MTTATPPDAAGPGPADGDATPPQEARSGRRGLVVAVCVLGILVVGAVVFATTRGGPPGEVEVADARAGESTGQAAAVYVTITPSGDDTLVGASSPAAAQVSLHEAEVTDGLTTMELTDELPLPAGEATELRPGGSHLMLENLTEPLEPGDRVEVTLEFAGAGERTVEVPVVPLAELVEGP